jgi:hypothetical protein
VPPYCVEMPTHCASPAMDARGCAGPRKQTKTLQCTTKLDLGPDNNDNNNNKKTIPVIGREGP